MNFWNAKKSIDENLCKVSKRISYKERREDALVHGAEEGRDKLRKAAESCKWALTRRYPNEGTHRK